LENPTCFAATGSCWCKQSATQLNAVWTCEDATQKGCVLGFKDVAQLSAFQDALARPAVVKLKKARPAVDAESDAGSASPAKQGRKPQRCTKCGQPRKGHVCTAGQSTGAKRPAPM
jgi:hypothetical protein